MCGFAGIINFSKINACSEATLKKMGSTLRYRGPDEESIYQDDILSFVFRRLSIVDVKGGSQPIWNEDGSMFVAVNGEIYNHVELRASLKTKHTFKTKSDSEILLHLYEDYGYEAFNMLNGMFAAVIWDKKQNKLVLVRDRMGIKPLYYTETRNGLLFGSELKAILTHPDCPKALNWGDMEPLGPQERPKVSTYVNDVHHLPAGSYGVLNHKAFEVRKYWDISNSFNNTKNNNLDAKQIEESYFNLLQDSVKKRLMSDVPVGLFLSGGIDSSTIAALLAKETINLHCFTVVERTTYRSGDVEQARKVCKSLGLPFYPIYFDTEEIAANFRLEDMESLICLIESPRFDPEWLFKSELHRAAKKLVPDLKVILLGQGADEFCGGYSKYLGVNWLNWEDYISHEVSPSIVSQADTANNIPERFKQYLNHKHILEKDKSGIYNKKMKMLTYQLQHFNLWHEDRTSSYHGIESRVPFLDHRLVELLAGIPEKYHAELFWNKKILRNASKKVLPDYPANHLKVPFFVSDDVASIDEFAISICKNIYVDFKTKYLDNSYSPFDVEDMDEIYKRVNEAGSARYFHAWQLLEHITICIFEQFCKHTEKYLNEYYFIKKPAFRLIHEDEWADIKARFDREVRPVTTIQWRLDSKVNIPQDCEILNPLTEREGATALVLLDKGQEKFRINIDDDNDWIVMLLDEMGRHTGEPKDVEFWTKKTKIPGQQLVGVLDNLVQGGFLTQVK